MTDNLADIVAANITRLRGEALGGEGLSVRQFAAALGISKSAPSMWATGKTRVPLHRLEDIARVLQVPLAQLLSAPPDAVPDPPMAVGSLREAIIDATDLDGCFGGGLHESKDVLLCVRGEYLRLAAVGPEFRNGRFALVLAAGAPDPASGSPAWYAEHPQAAEVARSLGMAVPPAGGTE